MDKEEDWFGRSERKLEQLKEGTKEYDKWKKCNDGLHTKLTLQIRLTYENGTKVDKVCENCGGIIESYGYNKDIDKVILMSEDEVVDRFVEGNGEDKDET